MVTAYVLMPDHVHFFAEPGESLLPFDHWISVWKRGMARILKNREWRWQAGSFHHRLRCYEDLISKRIYMDENPVRAGLVDRVNDWPYRGELFKSYLWWP
jgi:putative transposase